LTRRLAYSGEVDQASSEADLVADQVASVIAAAEEAAAAIRAEAEADAARMRARARAMLAEASEVLRRLDGGEEARAMALRMALGGRTRGEVEQDLRSGLRVTDPAAVLDEVFGRGTGREQRIPWAEQAKGHAP
jgi:hypothetical protein